MKAGKFVNKKKQIPASLALKEQATKHNFTVD